MDLYKVTICGNTTVYIEASDRVNAEYVADQCLMEILEDERELFKIKSAASITQVKDLPYGYIPYTFEVKNQCQA